MPESRRFPLPWTIEEQHAESFIVRDANGQALGYFDRRFSLRWEPSGKLICEAVAV